MKPRVILSEATDLSLGSWITQDSHYDNGFDCEDPRCARN
jgi:hypothetical protein